MQIGKLEVLVLGLGFEVVRPSSHPKVRDLATSSTSFRRGLSGERGKPRLPWEPCNPRSAPARGNAGVVSSYREANRLLDYCKRAKNVNARQCNFCQGWETRPEPGGHECREALDSAVKFAETRQMLRSPARIDCNIYGRPTRTCRQQPDECCAPERRPQAVTYGDPRNAKITSHQSHSLVRNPLSARR
jgi:hypothetical protein